MRRTLVNVWQLSVKELRSLWADKILLAFVVFGLAGSVFIAGNSSGQELRRAPVAVLDEDRTPLSRSLVGALLPPQFLPAEAVRFDEVDRVLDAGRYTFVLIIPEGFQRDVADGRVPALQVNLDATAMSQTMLGAGYVQAIVGSEIQRFLGTGGGAASPVTLRIRTHFNPNADDSRFIAVMELVNNITMMSIILVGAAVIREREHGTLEHLLVMPVRPNDIMLSKVLSNGLVVLIGSGLSLQLVVRGLLHIPVTGSEALFMVGAFLHIAAAASMGILLATVARSMPQLGLLMILVVLPMQMLSGGMTPRESMPQAVQQLMQIAPTTHFTAFSQALLYRGAGLDVVWPQLLALLLLGALYYAAALARFRRSVQ